MCREAFQEKQVSVCKASVQRTVASGSRGGAHELNRPAKGLSSSLGLPSSGMGAGEGSGRLGAFASSAVCSPDLAAACT